MDIKEKGLYQETTIPHLTESVVDTVLKQISLKPDQIAIDEKAYIKTFYGGVRKMIDQTEEFAGSLYLEGVLWTHRLLRFQANEDKTQLPKISEDLVGAFLQDRFEKSENLPDEALGFQTGEDIERIKDKDSVLIDALSRCTKYMTNESRTIFNMGIVDIYYLLEKAKKTEDLEKSFKVKG